MKSWEEIAIEEYKSLRQESADAIRAQLTIVNYGLTIIGALLAFAFERQDESDQFSLIIFLGFLPILCYIVIIIWLGEIVRMSRCGMYLSNLEKEFGKRFHPDIAPLGWETHLRSGQTSGARQMKRNYIATIALFLFAAILAILTGAKQLYTSDIASPRIQIIILGAEFVGLLSISVYLLKCGLNLENNSAQPSMQKISTPLLNTKEST
jgi:hypothetical protein